MIDKVTTANICLGRTVNQFDILIIFPFYTGPVVANSLVAVHVTNVS